MQPKKKPWLAGLLSFLIAGVGHFYLGLWKRGLAWLLSAIALGILLTIIAPGKASSSVGVVIGVFSLLDAKKQAEKMNAKAQ